MKFHGGSHAAAPFAHISHESLGVWVHAHRSLRTLPADPVDGLLPLLPPLLPQLLPLLALLILLQIKHL